LLGATVDRLKAEGNLAGTALENFVLMELRKQSAWSATQPELFYWRTASGQEVDVVLEDRTGRVVGVEVKAAATLSGNDVRGLQALATAARQTLGAWCGALHRHGSYSLFRQPARRSLKPALVGVSQYRSTSIRDITMRPAARPANGSVCNPVEFRT